MTRRLSHSFSLIAVVALAACAGTRLPGGEPSKPERRPTEAGTNGSPGTEQQGNPRVAVVNRNCDGGMHFVDGQGCVANVVSTPPQPVQPQPPEPGVAAGGMVRIPAGTFNMGSNDGGADEKPVHAVRVGAFEMDVTEVTVGAYRRCVNAGTCSAAWTDEYCNWGASGKEEHPINCVDWSQANSYCGWAGKRLPTEEEWEYGARGTDRRTYPWGNEGPGGQLCWSRWESEAATCVVGSYASGDSPFRLHDMAGNVSEWTASGYSADYSKSRDNAVVVDRGGGWFHRAPSEVRTADRHWSSPANSNSGLGFRCAR